jgi:hypothetical protein
MCFPTLEMHRDCMICSRSLRELTFTPQSALATGYHNDALILDAEGRMYRVLHAVRNDKSLINRVLGFLHLFVVIDLVALDLTLGYNLDAVKDIVIRSLRHDPITLEQGEEEEVSSAVEKCQSVREIVTCCCC